MLKIITSVFFMFYLTSCFDNEKPKAEMLNKNTAKIEITKSKNMYDVKIKEKTSTKDKSYYYSYSKKNKEESSDDSQMNRVLNANLNIKNINITNDANQIRKKLSKNFIIKCSACHSNYANGIIGPSLMSKSGKEIFDLMMKYKNNEKSNPLMDALIANMSIKEIQDISNEISELNQREKK